MSLKIYILSPHIDDAAYGLSLTIARLLANQVPVTLINCFTVTKWTAVPVASKRVEDVSRMRAEEDGDFNALFNSAIRIINLGLLDAPLRKGYILKFQPLLPDELELAEHLKNLLDPLVDGLLLCPLGVGDHIDHVICLEAAIKLYQRVPVAFFEDLPYSARVGNSGIAEQVATVGQRLGIELENFLSEAQDCGFDKEAAVRVYKSQINEEICSEIISYMNLLQGERLWAEAQVLEKLKAAVRC